LVLRRHCEQQQQTSFREASESGAAAEFLMLDPGAAKGAQLISTWDSLRSTNRFVTSDIKVAFSNIKAQLMEAISDDLKPRVQVRATKWFMTWSGVAVDPESDDGVIQLEFYHSAILPEIILMIDSTWF